MGKNVCIEATVLEIRADDHVDFFISPHNAEESDLFTVNCGRVYDIVIRIIGYQRYSQWRLSSSLPFLDLAARHSHPEVPARNCAGRIRLEQAGVR
jgi:hypothetical protein